MGKVQEEIFRLENKGVIDQDKEEMAIGFKTTAEELRKRLKEAVRERDDMKVEYENAMANMGSKDKYIREQEEEIERLKREIERFRYLVKEKVG